MILRPPSLYYSIHPRIRKRQKVKNFTEHLTEPQQMLICQEITAAPAAIVTFVVVAPSQAVLLQSRIFLKFIPWSSKKRNPICIYNNSILTDKNIDISAILFKNTSLELAIFSSTYNLELRTGNKLACPRAIVYHELNARIIMSL